MGLKDAPLAGEAARIARRSRLSEPHVAPLAAFAQALADRAPGTAVGMPDPCDGGCRARLLFLLEKPGAGAGMAAGFVSRDNPSGTSAAIRAFMSAADIPREATLLWNAVPWWNGTPRVSAREVSAGAAALEPLLALLPQLRAVVTVGRVAARSWELGGNGVPLFASAHPSGQVRAAFPARWREIPIVWRLAWSSADGPEPILDREWVAAATDPPPMELR